MLNPPFRSMHNCDGPPSGPSTIQTNDPWNLWQAPYRVWPSAHKPASHFILKEASKTADWYQIITQPKHPILKSSMHQLITTNLEPNPRAKVAAERKQKCCDHQSQLGPASQAPNSRREAGGSTASSPRWLSLTNKDRKGFSEINKMRRPTGARIWQSCNSEIGSLSDIALHKER